MKQLWCKECDERYDEDFFYQRSTMYTLSRRSPRCKACEQLGRDEAKATLPKRFLLKARGTFNHHARKFARSGLIKSAREMTSRYGWEIKRIAHDMEHAFKNGCQYCEEPFSSMPNGLSSLTLDILHPRNEPYYQVNVKFCCETCNRIKATSSPEDWARYLLNWKKALAARARKKSYPWKGTLFEGLGKE